MGLPGLPLKLALVRTESEREALGCQREKTGEILGERSGEGGREREHERDRQIG